MEYEDRIAAARAATEQEARAVFEREEAAREAAREAAKREWAKKRWEEVGSETLEYISEAMKIITSDEQDMDQVGYYCKTYRQYDGSLYRRPMTKRQYDSFILYHRERRGQSEFIPYDPQDSSVELEVRNKCRDVSIELGIIKDDPDPKLDDMVEVKMNERFIKWSGNGNGDFEENLNENGDIYTFQITRKQFELMQVGMKEKNFIIQYSQKQVEADRKKKEEEDRRAKIGARNRRKELEPPRGAAEKMRPVEEPPRYYVSDLPEVVNVEVENQPNSWLRGILAKIKSNLSKFFTGSSGAENFPELEPRKKVLELEASRHPDDGVLNARSGFIAGLKQEDYVPYPKQPPSRREARRKLHGKDQK